jgi:hypothetical protein
MNLRYGRYHPSEMRGTGSTTLRRTIQFQHEQRYNVMHTIRALLSGVSDDFTGFKWFGVDECCIFITNSMKSEIRRTSSRCEITNKTD